MTNSYQIKLDRLPPGGGYRGVAPPVCHWEIKL